MKKTFLFLILLTFCGAANPQFVQAQVGDIIGAAGSLGEGCVDGCGGMDFGNGCDGCGQGCNATDLFFLAQFIEWNEQWISNRRDFGMFHKSLSLVYSLF